MPEQGDRGGGSTGDARGRAVATMPGRDYEFEAVIESMSDGLFVGDMQGEVLRMNTAAFELLGFTEELMAKPLPERVRALNPQTADRRPLPLEDLAIARALRGETVKDQTVRIERPGGGPVWLSMAASPVMEADGRQTGVVATFKDITQRRLAEEALRHSERRLRDLIDNSPAVIYFKDAAGRLLIVNDEFGRLFETGKEQLLGKTDAEVLSEPVATRVRRNDLEVMATGEPMEFEEEVVTPAGERRTYISVKFPLWDVQGGLYGVAGISTDITDRKRREHLLRESEERFRRVFDDGPLGILLVDPDYRVSRANGRIAQMLGYTVDELVGIDVNQLTYPGDEGAGREEFEALLEGAIPNYRLDKRYVRRDGSPFWASLTVSLVRDREGRPMYTIGMVEDITERRRAEETLQEKDHAIRQAYVDVLDAVTGGKLVIVTEEELDGLRGEEVLAPAPLSRAEDVSSARKRVRDILQGIDGVPDLDAYVLAVGEALTNAVKHAGDAEYSVCRAGDTVQTLVTDRGPGLDFRMLPKATLVQGFSTKQTLGLGFTIMLDVCDRVLLATRPNGTSVVLEVELARQS